ncbi:MAG: hypothetical protein P8018_08760 [Acidobacteriota bacterium]
MMTRNRNWLPILGALLLTLGLCGFNLVQAGEPAKEGKKEHDIFKNLKFRDLGPAVAGGRVTTVVGIPGNSRIYYVGTAAGGIFKTTDGGDTWEALFTKEPVSSIGALAVDPQNTHVIWAATGEANLRTDIATGGGIYMSPDGGATWKRMGLKDAGQIARVIVNPNNPDEVFAAVVGHAWGPNAERGVYRTRDGGKTWKRVLFINDKTGCADLVVDPGNPKVLFAAMWEVVRYPWNLDNGGPHSGIYRSLDGGTTWEKLTKGLPEGPYGRIALAAAPSNPNHVYALIEAGKGMLWASEDLGKHWAPVNGSHLMDVRPFYFSNIAVSPDNENVLYFDSMNIVKSTDGGKTLKKIGKGVHVDHHAIWIDPRDPDRIIDGNDGGVWLSMTGGKTWRFLNNLPIEQFYQVAVDNAVPYDIAGGLQDNSGWMGPSRNVNGGAVHGDNWFTVVGGDGEYVVPAPSDPNIVYGDSQEGFIVRLDRKTGVTRDIRPYLLTAEQREPAKLKYRFNWTAPIAVSRTDADEVYLGANVVFKTTDGGKNWSVISPDLTRNDKSRQKTSGGPVDDDISGAENYDTILSLAISPVDPKVIWAGTDDGYVQVTRDAGSHWTETAKNISRLPGWGRVYQVDPSPFSAGTCYVSFDRHMLDDNRPYIYKTTDYGRHWTDISGGLPGDAPVFVVREDPNRKGLLFLGSARGLYYSMDDGASWARMKSNFPTVPVYDLAFQKRTHDLVVATHGRGVFVLDNITPMEEMSAQVENSAFHLFSALPAVMFHYRHKGEYSHMSTYSAPNPPDGAVIDYYLRKGLKPTKEEKEKKQTPVKVVITDSQGKTVNTLYGPAKAGVNRFVWKFRYKGAQRLSPSIKPLTKKERKKKTSNNQRGPSVVPGIYKAKITAAGKTQTVSFQVKADPRIPFDTGAARLQLAAALQLRDELSALNRMVNRIQSLHEQFNLLKKTAGADAVKYGPVLKSGEKVLKKLDALRNSVFNMKVQRDVGEDDIHFLSDFHGDLRGLYFGVAFPYDEAPNAMQKRMMSQYGQKLSNVLERYNQIVDTDLGAWNRKAQAAGLPVLFSGGPLTLGKGG